MSSVLIVEDDEAVAQALEVLLELHDIPCRSARTPAEALAAVAAGEVGVVLQDMNFRPGATSGDEGAALFRALRKADPELPVLLMTAWASLETAVALVREGATDYFGKPWDDAKLVSSLRNLLRLRALEAESARRRIERSSSRAELFARYDLRGLVYESDAMHRVVSLAVKIAAADVPVLVTGPNGAGKERLAEIVQANSRRTRRTLRQGQHRGASPRAHRERALRRRSGRLHGREPDPPGPLRSRAGRNALPRRDRRRCRPRAR